MCKLALNKFRALVQGKVPPLDQKPPKIVMHRKSLGCLDLLRFRLLNTEMWLKLTLGTVLHA